MEENDIVFIAMNREGLYYPKWYDTWGHFLEDLGYSRDERYVKEMEEAMDKGEEAECYGCLACFSYMINKVTRENATMDFSYVPGRDDAYGGEEEEEEKKEMWGEGWDEDQAYWDKECTPKELWDRLRELGVPANRFEYQE